MDKNLTQYSTEELLVFHSNACRTCSRTLDFDHAARNEQQANKLENELILRDVPIPYFYNAVERGTLNGEGSC